MNIALLRKPWPCKPLVALRYIRRQGEYMSDDAAGQERNWVLAAYGLFLIARATSGMTTLVGVVLAHLRFDAARGGLYESHYRNLILVFWVWLAVALVAAALFFAGLAGVV